MRKNFTAEQMLHTVRASGERNAVAEVCRKIGITEQTFYKWKRRVAGMGSQPSLWMFADSVQIF